MKWTVRIVQGLLILGYISSGGIKLTASREIIHEWYTDTLGYSEWFMYIIGAIELMAAIGLIVGYWKEKIGILSGGALLIIMVGAVGSNVFNGLISDSVSAFVGLALIVLFLLGKYTLYKPRRIALKTDRLESN